MRSFVVTMLFAAVIAEDGYTCTDSESAWGDVVDLSSGEITTADECKTACEGAIDSTTDKDWCCFAVAVADPESLACSYFSITADELDIRAAEEEAVDGTTNSAWAWAAGVALDDLAEEEGSAEEDDEEDDDESTEDDEEDDEDMSVRMTASAVAAASIAMLAM